MVNLNINLHIHSNYSDGKSSINSIVKKAIEINLSCIAITDHLSNSWKASIIPTLNNEAKISDYLEEINEVKVHVNNIGEDLIILKGVEIDLASSFRFITKLVDPNRFELILLEGLESQEGLDFAKKLVNVFNTFNDIKHPPLIGLAHFNPQIFIHTDYSLIISFLLENKLFLEINSNYIEYYSSKYIPFYEKIKKFNIPVSIGSDAHSIRRLGDLWSSLEIMQNYGLQKNYETLINQV